MSYLGIYLWTRLDAVLVVTLLTSVITGAIGAVIGIYCTASADTYGVNSDEVKQAVPLFKKFLTIFCIAVLLHILIPSKKDAALIYVVPTLAKSETIQEVAKATPEITKLGLDVLKETLEGLKKGNGNEQENNSSVK